MGVHRAPPVAKEFSQNLGGRDLACHGHLEECLLATSHCPPKPRWNPVRRLRHAGTIFSGDSGMFIDMKGDEERKAFVRNERLTHVLAQPCAQRRRAGGDLLTGFTKGTARLP
jgi:hypothetical protein